MAELTQERLKELLNYDPETGVFTWLVQASNYVRVGDIAGGIVTGGYRQIKVGGKQYFAHRLAWLYVHGRWPIQIDHINGVRDDSRIENLREAKSDSEQQQNRKLSSNNTSGFPGVTWDKVTGKWRARIMTDGKNRHLGLFDDLEEAATAHRAAKRKYHKFCPEVRDLLPEMQ